MYWLVCAALFVGSRLRVGGSTVPCTAQDFGIAYNGNRVFSVSSANETCICSNYASSGVSTFETAAVNRLSLNELSAGPSSTLAINGTTTFNGAINANEIVGRGSLRQVTVRDNLQVGSTTSISGEYRCGGFQGFYYQNTALDEPSSCSQLDAALNFQWPNSGPCTVCGGSLACYGWSARWSGYLLAPITGDLTLVFVVDDGVRVWWRNRAQPIVASWNNQNSTMYSAVVNVTAGSYYPIRIEYYQDQTVFQMMFQWYYAGQTIIPVPSINMCYTNGVTVNAGTSSFNGQVSFHGPAFFATGIGSPAGTTTINGASHHAGAATFGSGGVSVAGPVSASSTLAVGGTSSFAGAATFSGGVGTPASTTTINGASHHAGPATFANAVSGSSGTLNVTSALSVAGDLAVGGRTTFGGGVKFAPTSATTCPANLLGSVMYSTTLSSMVYCDGTSWVQFVPPQCSAGQFLTRLGTEFVCVAAPATPLAFNPRQLLNMSLWLDASDPVTMTLDPNGRVLAWNDKSGVGNHVQAASATSAPWFVASGIATGFASVQFSGTEAFLPVNLGGALSGEHTIVAVIKHTSVTANDYTPYASYYNSGAPGTNVGFPFAVRGSNRMAATFPHAGTGGNWNSIGLFQYSAGETFVSTFTFTPSGYIQIFKNGAWDGEGPAGTTTAARHLLIGKQELPTRFYTGYIAELFVFGRVLSTAERGSLDRYLALKWGIDAAKPECDARCVGGLAAWYDAADTLSVVRTVAGGSTVSQWLDRSGNGNHLTASSAANRPGHSYTALGTGLPGVVFGPTLHYFDTLSLPTVFGGPHSIIAVVRYDGNLILNGDPGYNPYASYFSSSSPGTDVGSHFYLKTNGQSASYPYNAGSNMDSTGYAGYTIGETFIQEFRYTGSECSLWKNGVHDATWNCPASGSVNGFNIGRQALAARQFRGVISEILIYPRALQPSERQTLETYLGNKYRIPLGISDTTQEVYRLASGGWSVGGGPSGWYTMAGQATGSNMNIVSARHAFVLYLGGMWSDSCGIALNFRIQVTDSAGNLRYFPDSTGWRQYWYEQYSRLNAVTFTGTFYGLALGKASYVIQVNTQRDGCAAGVGTFSWNPSYGNIVLTMM